MATNPLWETSCFFFVKQIVVIDEGTSNLDTDSEALIQLVIKTAFESSTVLLIAHRLNGVQQMNRLFVIDNGRIAEEGTPSDLAGNSDSRFYSLLDEQQATKVKSWFSFYWKFSVKLNQIYQNILIIA